MQISKFIELLQGSTPRFWLILIAVAGTGLLGFGLYLQHVQGLEPCPMCIVQRYALVLVVVFAALGAAWTHPWWQNTMCALVAICSAGGAFVAARQSWLQWYPPETAMCGRDLYGMIETFPLQRVVPMIFKGSGDCTKVDWTFLGLSIANWSFLCHLLITGVVLGLLIRVACNNR